jgi:hypothetical protein
VSLLPVLVDLLEENRSQDSNQYATRNCDHEDDEVFAIVCEYAANDVVPRKSVRQVTSLAFCPLFERIAETEGACVGYRSIQDLFDEQDLRTG